METVIEVNLYDVVISTCYEYLDEAAQMEM
jgi:hypothetical protein